MEGLSEYKALCEEILTQLKCADGGVSRLAFFSFFSLLSLRREDPESDPSALLERYAALKLRLHAQLAALESRPRVETPPETDEILKLRERRREADAKLLELAEKLMRVDRGCDVIRGMGEPV